jgi:hypothetical protein
MIAPIGISWHKAELRRPFASDCRGHLGTKPWGCATEFRDGIGNLAISRDDHMHEQATAIRRWKDFLDEQFVEAAAAICKSEV